MRQPDGQISIAGWIHEMIEGSGGMNDFEAHELVIWHEDERVAAARWIIRCLGNPRCAGSDEVLQAIMQRRVDVVARDQEQLAEWQEQQPIKVPA